MLTFLFTDINNNVIHIAYYVRMIDKSIYFLRFLFKLDVRAAMRLCWRVVIGTSLRPFTIITPVHCLLQGFI